jgi:hypothetical protein
MKVEWVLEERPLTENRQHSFILLCFFPEKSTNIGIKSMRGGKRGLYME